MSAQSALKELMKCLSEDESPSLVLQRILNDLTWTYLYNSKKKEELRYGTPPEPQSSFIINNPCKICTEIIENAPLETQVWWWKIASYLNRHPANTCGECSKETKK